MLCIDGTLGNSGKMDAMHYAMAKREAARRPSRDQEEKIRKTGEAYERKVHWWLYLPKPDPVDRGW